MTRRTGPDDPLDVSAPGAPSPPGRPARTPPTVLLVDDEPSVVVAMTRFLERLGFAVLAAGSGPEALTLVVRHAGPLWLVVTDVDMPGMSGGELARALGARYPETPVLFISGRPVPRDLSDTVTGRPAAFLAKPFALEVLRAAITALAGDPRDPRA